MSRTKNLIIDSSLVVLGVGLSTLFISTDGNGQNPLPVAAGMLLVVLVTGGVSFGLAFFVRSLLRAMVGSIAITEFVFLFYFVCRIAFSQHVDSHAQEEFLLLPIVFAVVSAPTVLLSCVGFGRLANRAYKGRGSQNSDRQKS